MRIRAHIDELMADLQQEKIADAEEVLRYLTGVIRGEATEEVAVGTPIGTEIITKRDSWRPGAGQSGRTAGQALWSADRECEAHRWPAGSNRR